MRLFDSQGNLVDSLTYGIQSPWPTEPNGNGPTLALKDPYSDNSLPDNWAASANHGTPGEINDVYNEFIESNAGKFPESYTLYQNYPNPFNIQTMIKFFSPKEGYVSLKVFNLLGKEIETVIDEKLTAGEHNFSWDGKDKKGNPVGSGLYFYTLDSPDFHQIKKMVLIR